jgi:hypothetical protein
MSYWKEMQQEERPDYTDFGDFACPACVTDPYLAGVLAANLEDEPCSYCGAPKAAPVYLICDEISATITAYYTDPANVLSYDSGEGGYQGVTYSTYELVTDEFGGWTECDELLNDVVRAFEGDCNDWCDRNHSGLSDFEALHYSWSDFSEQVKHRTRYLFLQKIDTLIESSDQIPPREMLDALGEIFQEFRLFYELPQATDLLRVRVVDANVHPATSADLGTPPREAVKSPNRMSPAGIPMFYAALDEVTAILETYDPIADKGRKIALARFRNSRPLTLLNLTNLPPVPSIFDLSRRPEHPRLAFLESFERDFTKPVDRKTDSHTEYVPTQVVTEFVRHRLRTPADKSVDGILYRSSRAGKSPAVVIFAEPKDCGPRNRKRFDPEPFLNLVDWRYVDFDEFRKSHPDQP